MPTFAGVTFALQWEDLSAVLERKLAVSVEHYPDTNTDEIQVGGVGNGRITLPVIIDDTTDLATLRTAMSNNTVGTLTGAPEGNLANMMLAAITGPRIADDGRIKANLEFLEET